METAIVPGIYDPSVADEDLGVSTEEAFELTRRLARDGFFVGISSGASLGAALSVARRSPDAVMVVIFPDGGEKYLSERFWDEADESGADFLGPRQRSADPLGAHKPRKRERGIGPR
jgi:cysteine synthase B